MTVKEMERQILDVFGWQVRWQDLRGKVTNWLTYPDGTVKPFSGPEDLPNLSDPGTFWPIFEEWLKLSEWAATEIYIPASGGVTFKLIGGEGGRKRIGVGTTTTEAGIRAWHAALVALGKIKETR